MAKSKNNFKSLYKYRNSLYINQYDAKNNKFGTINVGNKTMKFGLSKSETEWLDRLSVPMRSVPISGLSIINSKKTKTYIVDGFDPNSNTIYEFLGCVWHGHPTHYNLDLFNAVNKRSFRDLYLETKNRFQIFHDLGYQVFFVWECEYKTKKSFGRYYKGLKDNLLY